MTDRLVSHSNPVTQAGFTQIPNAVMLRKDLRPVAKLVYGYLKHIAWRSGDENVDPLQSVIASDLGVSEDAVRSAMRDLQKAPVSEGGSDGTARLLVSRRRGLGKTNMYLVNDPEIGESPTSGSGKNPDQETADRQNLPSLEQEKTLDRIPPTPPNRPAKVDRLPVRDTEYALAVEVLASFNRQAETRYGSKDYISKIIMRIREQPSMRLADHERVIADALAHPWWKESPSPSVIYGNEALFEKAIHAAIGRAQNGGEATAVLSPEEMASYGTEWGPGTPYESLAAARARPPADVVIEERDVIEVAE